MCPSFPFGFEGGTWDLIVLITDHCIIVFLFTLGVLLFSFLFTNPRDLLVLAATLSTWMFHLRLLEIS